MADFSDHVKEMHRNRDQRFEEEYKVRLPPSVAAIYGGPVVVSVTVT